MINEREPTTRSWHIGVKHFAIQEWRQHKILAVFHIPGILNPSDQQTKALGCTLHVHHARRAMGHYGPD